MRDPHRRRAHTAVIAGAIALAAVSGSGRVETGTALGAPPTIAFSTYVGGGADEELREVIAEADGSILVGGLSFSADFPVTAGALQTVYKGEPPGPGCNPGVCGGDLVIARLEADGSAIRAATFLGGSRQDRNTYGMALDRAGDIVVTSATRSADMPTTPGSFQPRLDGTGDIHVSKLARDLSALRWCTYVGGGAGESPRGGLALDRADRVWIVGSTSSADFPTTAGAYQRQAKGTQDAVVFALEADGSALVASTRLGGSDTDGTMGVILDPAGNVHIAGHTQSADFPVTAGAAQAVHGGLSDNYAAAFTPDLGTLLYATYIGGSANEYAEHRLTWLGDDTVLIPGVTLSPDYPTTADALQRALAGQNDGILSRVSTLDGSLVYSTLLGGSGTEFYLWPTPDQDGNVWLVGTTSSPDFPVTADALQPRYAGGPSGDGTGDGVIVQLDPTLRRVLYASYLGGDGYDLIRSVAIAPNGDLLLVGETSSSDFPVTEGAAQRRLSGPSDGFVVRLAVAASTPSATPPEGTAVALPETVFLPLAFGWRASVGGGLVGVAPPPRL